ncbi:acyl carrier protein phosphodiesterase [Aegicerativicinus sediminis]|uniref:acyl carrier protein phosphodiesterase n=1 Tax=Aegicerativicinus sediminis TaxID=2893202 RepID=UPI001E4BE56E|nr:ACP phosphodiesterase [Aegicerativicinus sediminis]
MNFLAHIYLSGENEDTIIGNFMADGIKGRKYENYPIDVQIGILLHREIDTFTDSHPIVKQSTKRLHNNYSHYSGVIVDILYDHFLAKNWMNYSTVTLDVYIQNFYEILRRKFDLLPTRVKRFVPYMISDNWLLSYSHIEGIQKVLNGMNSRTQNRSQMNLATVELEQYYTEFEMEFTLFFNELIDFSSKKLNQLVKEKHGL